MNVETKKQPLPQKKQTKKVAFQIFDDTARITNNNGNKDQNNAALDVEILSDMDADANNTRSNDKTTYSNENDDVLTVKAPRKKQSKKFQRDELRHLLSEYYLLQQPKPPITTFLRGRGHETARKTFRKVWEDSQLKELSERKKPVVPIDIAMKYFDNWKKNQDENIGIRNQ